MRCEKYDFKAIVQSANFMRSTLGFLHVVFTLMFVIAWSLKLIQSAGSCIDQILSELSSIKWQIQFLFSGFRKVLCSMCS